ncbi:MAG: hypothetical protein ACTSQK_07300, partial [Candidatus Heimdallarchaeota archaeon]
LTSEGVGTIPVTVNTRENESQGLDELNKQLATPFDFENEELPLARVIQFSSSEVSELVICALHIITDGMSMTHLIKDFVKYLANPEEPIIPLDLPTKDINPLTKKVRRFIPKSKLAVYMIYALLRTYNFTRNLFTRKRKRAIFNIKDKDMAVYSCHLDQKLTQKFLQRSKKENISIHSSLCTAFLSEYPIIATTVNLRKRLRQKIGEAFGFYSSVIVFNKRYNKARGFWNNARKFQRKLRWNLRDRKVYLVHRLLLKQASFKFLQKISRNYTEIATNKNPFSVNNLGSLEDFAQNIDNKDYIKIDSFFGGVTSFLDTFIVLVYTFRNEMYFHYHYPTELYSLDNIISISEKAKERILNAIK